MKVECPRCHTHVEMPTSGEPVCPTCGFQGTIATPGAPQAAAPSVPASAPVASAPVGSVSHLESTYGQKQNNGLAITAMVLGIVGFLTGFLFIGIFLDIAAIVVGIIAINKTKDPAYGGKGMAITGIVVGALGLVFMIALLAAYPALEGWVEETCNDLPPEERPADCDQFVDDGASQYRGTRLPPVPGFTAPWHV